VVNNGCPSPDGAALQGLRASRSSEELVVTGDCCRWGGKLRFTWDANRMDDLVKFYYVYRPTWKREEARAPMP